VVAATVLSVPVVPSRPAAVVEDGAEAERDGWRRRLSGRQLQDRPSVGFLLLLSVTVVIVLRDMLTRPLWHNEQWRAWHLSLYRQFLEQLPNTNSPMAAGWVVLTKASALVVSNSEVALRLPVALTMPVLVVGTRQLAAIGADARGPAFASGMPALVAAKRTNAGGGDVAVVVHPMAAGAWDYYMRFLHALPSQRQSPLGGGPPDRTRPDACALLQTQPAGTPAPARLPRRATLGQVCLRHDPAGHQARNGPGGPAYRPGRRIPCHGGLEKSAHRWGGQERHPRRPSAALTV
jgi:hypothetical protein